ncbi:hypothetical protein [Pseudonocardia sp. DLS-67]
MAGEHPPRAVELVGDEPDRAVDGVRLATPAPGRVLILHRLITDEQSQPQIEAPPLAALAPFAEFRAMLEVALWGGDPLSDPRSGLSGTDRCVRPSRTGLVTHLILERDFRVDFLDVLWLDD